MRCAEISGSFERSFSLLVLVVQVADGSFVALRLVRLGNITLRHVRGNFVALWFV